MGLEHHADTMFEAFAPLPPTIGLPLISRSTTSLPVNAQSEDLEKAQEVSLICLFCGLSFPSVPTNVHPCLPLGGKNIDRKV